MTACLPVSLLLLSGPPTRDKKKGALALCKQDHQCCQCVCIFPNCVVQFPKSVLMLKWSSISVSIHLYFLTCVWACNCTHKFFFEWPVTWMHMNCTCKDSPQLLLCLLPGGFVYKCKYVWLMSFSGGADKIRSRGLRNWV